MELMVVMHNVRSVYNAGSIFRTADAAGVAKIFLTGYTPAPIDRFGRERTDFKKVSLGAERSVSWQQVKNPHAALKALKREGYAIVALEQDAKAASLFSYTPPQKVALIVGNEVRGISAALRAKCDDIIEIPMQGKKESLNVSVAAGIALFTLAQAAQ